MRDFLMSFLRDESGAAAAEYALIVAVIGTSVALAATDLGAAISAAITTSQGNI